jgi:hypothetical protein
MVGDIAMIKKKCIQIIVLFLITITILLNSCSYYSLEHLPEGDYLCSSFSPERTYRIDAYKCSGNATTDFSIRCSVCVLSTEKEHNIYWAYHQDSVNIEWISNDVVLINGIYLNVLTDTYDWRV